jgi:tRNA uridine 5-carboxymethylaminomethyl modification enzyme
MKALRQVPGFEQCRMFRPGYAIEYDYFPPTQLRYTLETKLISGLFFAGQVNGTTGYEEAACQGLIAGMNAHLASAEQEPFVLGRSEAYIGVLIDDLINKGTDEPYRMFTSRAEFRTLLRQDNADLRLTEKSNKAGLANNERLEKVLTKKSEVEAIRSLLLNFSVDPSIIGDYFDRIGTARITEKYKAAKLLLRPMVELPDLVNAIPELKSVLSNFSQDAIEQASIQVKYEAYIDKEKELVHKMSQLENQVIPDAFDYSKLSALSTEARQKFNKIKPRTLGQASRISGVNPSDVQILMVYMGR